MLRRPTHVELRALDNLRRTQPWATVETYLNAELALTVERLMATDKPETMWNLQGRAKMLTEFLKVIRDAETDQHKVGG